MAIWQSGNMAIYQSGNLAIWQSGKLVIQTSASSWVIFRSRMSIALFPRPTLQSHISSALSGLSQESLRSLSGVSGLSLGRRIELAFCLLDSFLKELTQIHADSRTCLALSSLKAFFRVQGYFQPVIRVITLDVELGGMLIMSNKAIDLEQSVTYHTF